MARIGKHKSKYDKYKNSGRREMNKDLKRERHEKKVERFARRREQDENYQYSKERAESKRDFLRRACEEEGLNTQECEEMVEKMLSPNFGSNRGKHTYLAKETSVFRKLENFLKKRKEEEKKKKKKRR